jgi:hypothetical protein
MRASPFALLKSCALLLCLFAPSAWMIATVPPLWRDADAYIQVTQDPLVATFWGHAPAYSYAARVPLFLGEQWERMRGTATVSRQTLSSHLTNSGVWLLILAQHLALCGAALYFICAISNFFWIRLALAAAWASNALFYTFAHCVGSETLSLVLVVLLVAKGLHLIGKRGEPRWIDWYVFALGLCLCLLSRHVNLWLILLLPATFLLSWALDRISSLFASVDRPQLWLPGLSPRHLRQAAIAIGVGVACFAIAHSSIQGLARKTRFHPHSRIGFTFLWRLHFLKKLSPESRAALLQKVAERTHSTETRKLIALLGEVEVPGVEINAGQYLQRASKLIFPGREVVPWEQLDGELNQMAWAFLLPPTSEHFQVARNEFISSMHMPVTEISSYLFQTTAYYFEHKDEMPGCSALATFHDADPNQIKQIPFQHSYFQLWRGLTYNKTLILWFVSLLLLLIVARAKRTNVAVTAAFGITLSAIGLLMIASTCLLGSFIPRYGLPMWQLLFLSLCLFLGTAADLMATATLSRSNRPL